MKRIALALSLALCMAQAPAIESRADVSVIMLNTDETQTCKEGGGCHLITERALEQLKSSSDKRSNCGGREA